LSITNNINKMLLELEYSEIWLKSNCLTKNILIEQYDEFLKSEDKNTEHYRYKTLKIWIKNKKTVTNDDLDFLLQIYEAEQDKFMMESFITTLIFSNYFNEFQLEKIAFLLGENIKKEISKAKLLSKIKTDINQELIDEIIQENNNAIVLKLVEKLDDKKQLEYIINNYMCSKKIKNIINQKLNKNIG